MEVVTTVWWGCPYPDSRAQRKSSHLNLTRRQQPCSPSETRNQHYKVGIYKSNWHEYQFYRAQMKSKLWWDICSLQILCRFVILKSEHLTSWLLKMISTKWSNSRPYIGGSVFYECHFDSPSIYERIKKDLLNCGVWTFLNWKMAYSIASQPLTFLQPYQAQNYRLSRVMLLSYSKLGGQWW